ALYEAPPGPTPQDRSRVIMDALAEQVAATPSAVDFGNAALIQSVVQSVGESTGQVLADELVTGASSVIAATNRELDALDPTAGADFFRQAEQIKLVSQGAVVQALARAAAGEVEVAAVVAGNTGDALAAQI